MKFIRGFHNIPRNMPACVATLGNFDGLHRGHQAVLTQLMHASTQENSPRLIIIFEPQPQEFFRPQDPPARLSTLRDKLQGFAEAGIEYVCCLPFNAELATLSAEDFMARLLCQSFNIKRLVVGDDFRFGRGRQGDFQLLHAYGKDKGIAVEQMQTASLAGKRISSTRIRQALANGAFKTAEALVGRPYLISGRVIHGDKRGRMLGFPTANIALHRLKAPAYGVHAVRVIGLGPSSLPGVASLGWRPTIGDKAHVLEIYLFDFNKEIYGRSLSVALEKKLRDEKKFKDLTELTQAMQEDERQARAFFANLR